MRTNLVVIFGLICLLAVIGARAVNCPSSPINYAAEDCEVTYLMVTHEICDNVSGRFVCDDFSNTNTDYITAISDENGAVAWGLAWGDYYCCTSSDGNVPITINTGGGNDDISLVYGSSYYENTSIIYAGAGSDDVRGSDYATGTGWRDIIFSSGGADDIECGDGADYVSAVGASDGGQYDLGDGDDMFRGSSQEDFVFGGDGRDEIYGEGDNDTLYGEGDQDYIDGGAGSGDEVYGGNGWDILCGGSGADTVSGGQSTLTDTCYDNNDTRNLCNSNPNSADGYCPACTF